MIQINFTRHGNVYRPDDNTSRRAIRHISGGWECFYEWQRDDVHEACKLHNWLLMTKEAEPKNEP